MDNRDENYLSEVKTFAIKQQIERIIYELQKYYNYYNDSNESLKQFFNSTFDQEVYSSKEKNQMLEEAIKILKNKHNIIIKSRSPLKLEQVDSI